MPWRSIRLDPTHLRHQNAARCCCLDVFLEVFGQKKARQHELLRGNHHGINETCMVLVAFLERRPWIAACEPLREGGREWNVGACQSAQAILWTMRGVSHVPSGAGAERYADLDRPHAGDVEAVRICFRHEHRVAGTDK